MSTKVSDAIMSYLDKPQTDYAIMINGDWGIGKTFFWKNHMQPLIENSHNVKPIYVSLYGITSTEEISKRIFLEIYPLFKKVDKYFELAKTLLNISGHFLGTKGIGSELKLDLKVFNNRRPIYCFDDFERVKLDSVEVLGYINRFVEHDNSKTIIIANEKLITEINQPSYQKYKEKLIGKTLTFKPEFSQSILGLLGGFTDDSYAQYINSPQTISLIIEVINRSHHKNLRSVKRVLSDFFPLYAYVHKEFENAGERMNTLLNWLLEFSIILTLEINAGVFKREMIDKIENDLFSPQIYREYEKMNKKQEITIETRPQMIFEPYCIDAKEQIYFSKNIAGYLFTGEIDMADFHNECDSVLNKYITGKETDNLPRPIHVLLYSYWEAEDYDMEGIIASVYSDMKEGNFNLESYPLLYNRFENLINQGYHYILFNKEELMTDVLKGLGEATKRLLSEKDYLTNLHRRHFNPFDYGQPIDFSDKGKAVLNQAKAKYDEIIEQQERIYTQGLFELLPTQFEKFLQEVKQSHFMDIPILKYIESEWFFSTLVKLSNKEIIQFLNIIRTRGLDNDEKNREKSSAMELIRLLEANLIEIPISNKKLVLKSFCDELKKQYPKTQDI